MTADKWTDQEILKLEKKISKEYAQAQKELDQKAKEYFREYADRWKREEVYHQAGILSEDAFGRWFKTNRDSSVTDSELKDIYKSHTGRYTDESFKAWEISQLGRGAHWEDLKNQMTERLAQSAIIAQDYINNKLPAVYTKNSNEIAKIAQDSAMDQGITGIRFDLVDEYAIKRLAEGSREVRPYKPIIIDLPKTNRFNYTKLQNALIQGILQGDSIEHLADRFEKVSNMNRASAIRNARTACTGAQNGGKQDRYADLASKGCDVFKMWIATPDERTRDEHMEAWQEYGDKESAIPYDEPFDVGGEELMFPADPNGSPWNVYNCRCTMRSTFVFKSILSDEMRERANIRLYDEEAQNEPNTEPQEAKIIEEEKRQESTAITDEERAFEWAENLSDDEKMAVEWYVSGDGMEANNYLRKRGWYSNPMNEADDELKENIKNLDSAIDSYGGLKESGTYYRNVDASAFFTPSQIRQMEDFAWGDNDGKDIKSIIGKEITDKGYLSTTSDLELVEEWGDFTGSEHPIIVEYDVPAGAKGANLKAFDIEEDPQNETLFARNSKVEITDVEVGKYHMIKVKARMI